MRSSATQSTIANKAESPANQPFHFGVSRISYWIVTTLILWLALDILPRFLPVSWLHILPEHVATRRPGKFTPFIPNLTIRYDPWIGETAMTGNLQPMETRTALTFSTDSLGFRLTPGVQPNAKIDYLLFGGASFAYGGGLNDDETFPAAFTRQTGQRMYNGGHFFWDLQGLDALDYLLAKLGDQHPAVILLEWEQLEHEISNLTGLAWITDRPGAALLGPEGYHRLRTDVQYANLYLHAFWNISPLEVFCIRGFKWLCDDRILPNRYKQAVVEKQLPDGKRILFLRDEVNRTLHPPDDAYVRRRADYFDFYARELAKRKLQVYVILIPNRYTLYGSLVAGYHPAQHLTQPRYLDRLETTLRERHVPVMNTLRLLEPHAAEDVASGNMAFYREDHHWTAEGVRRVAAAFADKLKTGAF